MTIMTTVFDRDFTEQLEEVYSARTRTKTFNGREYKIQATDPYGAWSIVNNTPGKAPESFNQRFTTTDQAWMCVEAYENANKDRLDQANARKQLKRVLVPKGSAEETA